MMKNGGTISGSVGIEKI